MSIQIEYTPAGDLLIRCGSESMVWPLAAAQHAAGAGVTGGAPASPPAPATADPSIAPPPLPPMAPPPKPPKIGYPPPLPGVMTIVSRRSHGGALAYPWFAADWPAAAGLELPLDQLQGLPPELLLTQLRTMMATRALARADRCLTVLVQPSLMHGPLDVGQLQWLADDPALGLEGVRLQFGVPSAGKPG